MVYHAMRGADVTAAHWRGGAARAKKGRDDDHDVDYDGGARRRPSDEIVNDDDDEGDDLRRSSDQCRDE
jgi:hypothetical protein